MPTPNIQTILTSAEAAAIHRERANLSVTAAREKHEAAKKAAEEAKAALDAARALEADARNAETEIYVQAEASGISRKPLRQAVDERVQALIGNGLLNLLPLGEDEPSATEQPKRTPRTPRKSVETAASAPAGAPDQAAAHGSVFNASEIAAAPGTIGQDAVSSQSLAEPSSSEDTASDAAGFGSIASTTIEENEEAAAEEEEPEDAQADEEPPAPADLQIEPEPVTEPVPVTATPAQAAAPVTAPAPAPVDAVVTPVKPTLSRAPSFLPGVRRPASVSAPAPRSAT